MIAAPGRHRCVLKILRSQEGVAALAGAEAQRWNDIWGISAQCVIILGAPAVLLPLLHVLGAEEWEQHGQLVREAVRHMADRGYCHGDLVDGTGRVKAHHFALARREDGATRVVLLDLSDVKRMEPGQAWARMSRALGFV